MTSSQIELNYRLSSLFGPEALIQVFNLAIENVGFDEGMQFDLVLHKKNDERLLLEITPVDIRNYIHPRIWPEIHQVIFSNHWIKGMNIKIQLVKRSDYSTLSVKCEMEDAEQRARFVHKLEEQLGRELRATGPAATEQDRERLFGSMLMTEPIIQVTRNAFLAGDFKNAMAGAIQLLNERLERLLKQRLKGTADVLAALSQAPPRLIFPDLSGKQLHNELLGLAYLHAGILTLFRPVIEGKRSASEDPARVLKSLVLIGMLLERFEGAGPNPAIGLKKKSAARGSVNKKTRLKIKEASPGKRRSKKSQGKAEANVKKNSVRADKKTVPKIKKRNKPGSR